MLNFLKSYKNTISVVTGGASGIGAGIVQKLIELEGKVIIADFDSEKLKAMEEQYRGKPLITMQLDVTNEKSVQRVVDELENEHGRIDYGFFVAGINRTGGILDDPSEDWLDTINVNLIGNYYMIHHLGASMRKHKKGSIVIVSSLNARVPMLGGSAYAVSKAAVEMLVKNASIELADHGIRINCILPGLTETPLIQPLLQIDSVVETYMKMFPLKRLAQVDEIALPALFIASDMGSYINGASLIVDGGWQNTGYGGIDFRNIELTSGKRDEE